MLNQAHQLLPSAGYACFQLPGLFPAGTYHDLYDASYPPGPGYSGGFASGRVMASYGAPVINPGEGPPFFPFRQPLSIHHQLPPRGRITWGPGYITPRPVRFRLGDVQTEWDSTRPFVSPFTEMEIA